MRRVFTFAVVTLLGLALTSGSLWADRGRGGAGGRGGGGGSMRSGGGGSFRGGGGGSFRGGGSSSRGGGSASFRGGAAPRGSSFRGSASSRSSLSAGSAFRGSSASRGPAIRSGSSLSRGSIDATRRSGGSVRVSPGASALRQPRGNVSGGAERSLSGLLGRSIGDSSGMRSRPSSPSNRPDSDASLRARVQSEADLGARTRPGGQGQGPLRVGGSAGGRARGEADADITSRGGERSLSLRANADAEGNARLRAASVDAGVSRGRTERVSPERVGEFLSLSRRAADGDSTGRIRADVNSRSDLARSSDSPGSRGGRSADRFRDLSRSEISRLNDNLNVAFRRGDSFDRSRFNDNWRTFNPRRGGHWNRWAGGVYGGWNPNRYYGCFNNRFWARNFVGFPWPRFNYWWTRPWGQWWGCPNWGSYQNWFPSWGWSTPYYYDYGPGGNVVFNSGYVYMNDQPIATVADYAASAAELAKVPEPSKPEEATEWLPLGTFALSTGEEDKDPSRVIQLAVDKDGNISGTMVNQKTDESYAIQGRVDKETQRVAFTIGANKDVVLETGIYNLTQKQTPLLALGEGREETYLLLRLDPPAEGTESAAPGETHRLVP